MNIRHAVSVLVKASIISVAVLMLAISAAIYGLPVLLKTQLPEKIQQQTGRPSAITDIQLGLFPLALKLQGFSMTEKNGQPFASFDTLYLSIDPWLSISQAALMIDHVLLDKPYLHISRRQDGVFNFNDLIKIKTTKEPKNDSLFPVTITKLSVSTGKLVWEDSASGRIITETITPIQLDIDDLTTRTDTQARLNLSLDLASGSHLNWKGALGINHGMSKGHIKLDNVNLQKLPIPSLQQLKLQGDANLETDYQLSIAEDKINLSVNQAKLSARNVGYEADGQMLQLAELTHHTDLLFNYNNTGWQLDASKATINSRHIRLQTNALLGMLSDLALDTAYTIHYADQRLNVIVNQGKLGGKGLQLSEQGKQLAAIPTLSLDGIVFNLNDHLLGAASVTVDDAAVKAWLDANGMLNYQTLLPATDLSPALPAGTAQKKTPWHIAADNITLNNGSLDFEDRTLEKPFALQFKPIDCSLTHFSTEAGAQLPFQLNVGINKGGAINLNGSATVTPFAVDTHIDIKDIDLANYQAYFDRLIRLDVIDGMLVVDGQLSVVQHDKLDIKFNGNSGIAEFLTRDRRVHKDFVKWENLTLKDIAVDVRANRYTANTLVIDKPYARVTIRKDKTINFSGLLVTDTAQAKPAAKLTIANPAYFKLGKIQITDGSSDFTDLSLILPFSAHVQSLDGGADGVSSDKNSTLNVMLKGNAYDLAPVDVTGKISPYLGDYNVEINFKGLPMPLVSPYMVQFAGYKVEKGKMSLKLNYKVVDKQLTASNNLLIDQFELGEKVDNPDAVPLPLKLAVALLKDGNGKIKFDVPVTGSLEDPQFNLGTIIRHALVNAIKKIVLSPFNAIASLIGSQKDLSTISFNPGSSALNTPQQTKLAELSKALQERPQLTLEIKGVTDQIQDWPAISDDALYDQLKIRRAAEINQKSPVKIRPEYVALSTEDHRRLLAAMFIEKFPLLAEQSLLGAPALKPPQAGDFYDIAKQKLQEIIKPEEERLQDLAAHRAQAIAKYIVQKGGIAQERVYILDPAVNPGTNNVDIVSLLFLKAD
ncbi:MAG: DUF748 domain-containing protein [Methylovulum sp.]|nr:DUF748 domain-containing protein [Methylovulum sp.]